MLMSYGRLSWSWKDWSFGVSLLSTLGLLFAPSRFFFFFQTRGVFFFSFFVFEGVLFFSSFLMPTSDKDMEVVGGEEEEEDNGSFSDDEICLPTKDPLCDYRADEEDADWVHKYLMMGYDEDVHRSDATLNCPCCFALLCLDSQQHEVYNSQFRAMFVKNCVIDFDRMFFYDRSSPANKSPLKEVLQEEVDRVKFPMSEIFYKASCALCETEVGVFDSDEVFHFHNVYPSEPPTTRKDH